MDGKGKLLFHPAAHGKSVNLPAVRQWYIFGKFASGEYFNDEFS